MRAARHRACSEKKRELQKTRRCSCESCIRGIRFCQPRDIPITLTPFDTEFLPDGAVKLRLGFSGAEQSCDIPVPLVNLRLRGFVVGVTLAASGGWWFGWCHLFSR